MGGWRGGVYMYLPFPSSLLGVGCLEVNAAGVSVSVGVGLVTCTNGE